MAEGKSGCVLRIGGLFWLANLIYTCLYWGGWHALFNIFVPYAIIFDLVWKFSPYIRG